MTPQAISPTPQSLDTFSIIIFLFIGLVIAIVFFSVRKTIREQDARNRLLEQNFENTILSELSKLETMVETSNISAQNSISKDSDHFHQDLPENTEIPLTQSVATPLINSELNTPSPDFRIDQASQKILNQLRNANLSDGIFDFVAFHGNPQYGLSIRLRTGKIILILPNHESDAFQRLQLKRFDFIIFIDRNGNGLISTSLENFIADKMVF